MFRTLKGKISLIYLCLVLMIAAIGVTSIYNLSAISQNIEGLMLDNYNSIHALSNMLELLERQDSAIIMYNNLDRQKGISLFSDSQKQFWEWYDVENNNITETGEKELVADIKTGYKKYIAMFDALKSKRDTAGLDASIDYYNKEIIPCFTEIKQKVSQLSKLNEIAMYNRKTEVNNDTHRSMNTVLILSLVCVIGGFLLSRFLTGRFLNPIYFLTNSIRKVKEGNLDQRIETFSNDEIGTLSKEFNSMLLRLQSYEKSALGKLMTEKNKSLAIIKSISEPLMVLDITYRISLINNSFENFFDVRERKVINTHFSEVIQSQEILTYLSTAIIEKEASKEKIINFKRNGEDLFYNVKITKVRSEFDKHLAGFIIVFQDVTHLKQLEKVKTDFVATISHEFKTPLTSILMGASLIYDGSLGPLNQKQLQVMETIKEDGERLSSLVSNLLELSRLESGNAIYSFEQCSILDIINEALKPMYVKAEENGVLLSMGSSGNIPAIYADPEKILWVINNLITNALKYTGPGDEIQVSVRSDMENVYVSVKDTGKGIPSEYLEKIFDKFVQVKNYDLEVRGTGLGLAIVKDIVEAHNGFIRCVSKPDEGSNFIFTLPVWRQQ